MRKKVTLSELEAGSLFSYKETIGFKSEYRTENAKDQCKLVVEKIEFNNL